MDNKSQVIGNLSSRIFSTAETNSLSQKLNHSFFPKKLDNLQVPTTGNLNTVIYKANTVFKQLY